MNSIKTQQTGRIGFGMAGVLLMGSLFGFLGRPTPSEIPSALVFDRVTVVDVQQGREVADQRVVIVGNHIQMIGQRNAVRIPSGARVIEAQGQYLIPGLWDVHIHSILDEQAVQRIHYPLFIASGITGFRDAGTGLSMAVVHRWQRDIIAGTMVGPPRQIWSGPLLNGPDSKQGKQHGQDVIWLADTADARQMVDSLRTAGVDMIKTYDLQRDTYFAIAAECRRLGLPFGGHAQHVTPLEAVDSGARIVDHLSWLTSQLPSGVPNRLYHGGAQCVGAQATVAECGPLAARFRQQGAWLVPTALAFLGHAPQAFPEIAPYFAAWSAFKAGWSSGEPLAISTHRLKVLLDSVRVSKGGETTLTSRQRAAELGVLRAVGMPMLAGTDVGLPEFALHVELAVLVAEGLSPIEALRSATLNPARMWHMTDSLGTVEAGKLADLVLLDADPLQDITNTLEVRGVVANGRYFDRAALDQLRQDAGKAIREF